MIKFTNIKKQFSGKAVLKGVSGEFRPGEVSLVLGGSGTGKSVLVKCLVDLVQPDAGKVYFGEQQFTGADVETQVSVRRNMGMLFQGGALFDSLTVAENVQFPLDVLTKMGVAAKRKRVRECLERVDLAAAHKKLPAELSGGMKKRVALARAIVNTPAYLFCDEPNSGLDPQTAPRIDRLIQEITYESGITTVVITHDINSMVEIGDHIIFLSEGKKYWEGTSKDIFHADSKEFNAFFLSSKLAKIAREKERKK